MNPKVIHETIINTSECQECVYSDINYIDKSKIYINCSKKEKQYFYGQCIPCSYKKKKEKKEEKDIE